LTTNHLVFKLVLTPLIVIAATLVARRWGEGIGGLLLGLPLTSGPVSIFFAMEQGRVFAAKAAGGAMLGLIPVVVFCLGYSLGVDRLPWYLASLGGISLYFVAVGLVSLISPGLVEIVILVSASLIIGLALLKKPGEDMKKVSPAWWDLPLRIVFATTLVVLVTGLAGALGPKWGGLFSPFPVFTFVMVNFSHSQGGPGAALRLMRGVLSGLFAYVAFFVVVGLLMLRIDIPGVYALASIAALAVNGAALLVVTGMKRRRDEGVRRIA
jgi:hypothetical protein